MEMKVPRKRNKPAAPVFGPHFGAVKIVWLELVTVKSIAGIDL